MTGRGGAEVSAMVPLAPTQTLFNWLSQCGNVLSHLTKGPERGEVQS